MANPYKIQIPASNTGHLQISQSDAVAAKASELLQKDLETHHVFFNLDRYHNHIVHHVLALFGTGAGRDALQAAYDENANYQRPPFGTHNHIPDALLDWVEAKKYLGKENYYSDFLAFFQRQIGEHGYEKVLNEYLFKGDERADDMFQRMFSGFLHPIIQLMYGIEWQQPAIIAEALAQASVHNNKLKEFFDASEAAAKSAPLPMPPILDLINAVAKDEKLSKAAQMKDSNKIFDGILVRAPDEMIRHAGKVKITPEELDEKTAEMFHTAVYVAMGAAIHPTKRPRADFFLMHHVNAAPIFLSFNSSPWISTENKVRMLEYKIRMDLVQFAARGCPKLSFESAASYKSNDETLVSKPSELFPRFHAILDDGHTIKLARALNICQELSKQYQDNPWMRIKGHDTWLNLNYLVLDAEERPGTDEPRWIRAAGFEEAWENIPNQQ